LGTSGSSQANLTDNIGGNALTAASTLPTLDRYLEQRTVDRSKLWLNAS
jgi:hypothetical protein